MRTSSQLYLTAIFALALVPLLSAGVAGAHALAPSLLDLRERGDGSVEVRWKQALLLPAGVSLEPVLPSGCNPLGDPGIARHATSVILTWIEACPGGLVGGTVRVRGLDESNTDALVRVELADGHSIRSVLSGSKDVLVVTARQARLDVVAEYLGFGFRHILSGLDHLVFVLGLVLLVSSPRALLAMVTAFTLGHSATLSLAALGFVAFPSRVIEVAIAASILVLALELRSGGGARKRPWIMALCFGLLHGLGFAGALTEAGLPPHEIPMALFSFNIGIELGQLLFVACVFGLRAGVRTFAAPIPVWASRAPIHAIGTLGAYWCWERAALLFL